jgi:hypothetical protein
MCNIYTHLYTKSYIKITSIEPKADPVDGPYGSQLEMTMRKYPRVLLSHTQTQDEKIASSGHPYSLMGVDLPHTHTHVGRGDPSGHPYP